MDLNQIIKEFLGSYKKKTIELSKFEKLCSGKITYEDFASTIQSLIDEDILTPFKTNTSNLKEPSLHYKYRFNKPKLNTDISHEIHLAQKKYNIINLSNYYHTDHKSWKDDLPYIKQIHEYLLINNTLPQGEVLHTELSFQLVGDEKWIEKGKGQTVLERLGLWDSIKIQKHPDPLMLAVDTAKTTQDQHIHYHLIVENKSTYYALVTELTNTVFTSLIYGQGWKITSNIITLEQQLPSLKTSHEIYYFGDLDYEGIAIWYKLNQIRKVDIAAPFYKELLGQKESYGSKNQKRQEEAVQQFLSCFGEEKEIINNLLIKGNYYPQEAILEKDLQDIFKNFIAKTKE